LVCSGIPYEDSPYAAAHGTWKLSDHASLLKSDADAVRKGIIKSGTIRSASDIARYYYERGCCFTDPACAGPGDLVFFRAKPDKVPYQKHFHGFLCISHVGILTEDLHFLEATGAQIKPADPDLVKDPIRQTPLSSRQDIVCFARPVEIMTGLISKT
ncbi:MAG: C40 family peptidase, partial [Lachnospiraceae bacterium]|nr:C40 family peptidase [Lachnospiraceae bacterium]